MAKHRHAKLRSPYDSIFSKLNGIEGLIYQLTSEKIDSAGGLAGFAMLLIVQRSINQYIVRCELTQVHDALVVTVEKMNKERAQSIIDNMANNGYKLVVEEFLDDTRRKVYKKIIHVLADEFKKIKRVNLSKSKRYPLT